MLKRQLFRSLFLLLSLGLLLTACGGTGTTTTTTASTTPVAAPAVTLNVFAAASLTESFKEMAANYQQAHSNVKLVFNFAGSQALVQQISNGAPADIFASADQTNMQKASAAGLVVSPQVFAKNKLVLIIPVSNPGKITTLKDLANKGIKIDIGASSVPAGKYSLQVFANMGKAADYGPTYVSALKANIVSQEDNVKAVVQKVQLGEVDAGFVYKTDVTATVANKVQVIDIPDNFNVIASYPIAVTKNSTHQSDAQAFVQYVLSPAGQTVLSKYKFLPPGS